MFYSAERIFDGERWRNDVIETDGSVLRGYCTQGDVLPGSGSRHFRGCTIVPAFVDAQVYGAGGRLFSAYPDPESLQRLAEASWAGGAALCQPTVATNSPEVVRACIDALRRYWNEGGEGVGGLHLEGPWISPERRGAHIPAYIHPPTKAEVRELLEYGRGIIHTITLAPEQCAADIIEDLLSAGIILSAGHSNCSYDEAIAAFGRGIGTVTHLYNAMSPLQHRAPGLVGACFGHRTVCASIIPDGHHVHWPALRIAARLMEDRLFAITDAVTATGTGPYRHQLSPEGYYTSEGTLSGSALTMDAAFRNLRTAGALPVERALQMCGALPARVFGWSRYGKLGPGSAACFLVYDRDWNLLERISEPGSRSPALCGGARSGETS